MPKSASSFRNSVSYLSRKRQSPSLVSADVARPQTAVSVQPKGEHLVAILEGRGISREVGIATLDQQRGRVTLVQLADFQTYVKTLHQLHIYTPSLIILPDTAFSTSELGTTTGGGKKQTEDTSLLVECIRDEFPDAHIEPVLRRYWNHNAGLEFVHQLSVEGDERAATLIAVSSKYYALSAASALFKYAENKLNNKYATSSLRISLLSVKGTMMIDPNTSRSLELISNTSFQRSNHSLFGALNHTYTAMGARLLRMNILSPLTANVAINARLDAVEELIQNEDCFTEVRDALKLLTKIDFDKLISSLSVQEAYAKTGAKVASSRVARMLNLRTVLKGLPALYRALEGTSCQLLCIIRDSIGDSRLTQLMNTIDESLNEEVKSAKTGLNAVNARVYAVKANCNRLLDVARETYKENVGDIFFLNRTLCEKYQLPLQLIYQDTIRGFVFGIKKSNFDDNLTLPSDFNNISVQRGRVTFSSLELQKRNARMKDALDESLILSDKVVQDLLGEVVFNIGALYKASEAVALLDMLWSFSHVSILRNYVRPEFTGTLAIKAGRHPVLECIQAAGQVVPNDIYCSDSAFFQLIHGPNMAGKSTYLRQVGLLTVMAMGGCFVPAEYASFRIHDALLSRLSNEEGIEKNLSTFAQEMTSSAMILGLATSNSLVLIDELGRGTSPREGVGISHAIAESLIRTKCFVFFTTHFYELSTTLSRQPSVVNLHLSINKLWKPASSFSFFFSYKVTDGISDHIKNYGIELSHLAELPSDVVSEGRRLAQFLSSEKASNIRSSATDKVAQRRKALTALRTQVSQSYEHSNLPDSELVEYLARIQWELAIRLRETL